MMRMGSRWRRTLGAIALALLALGAVILSRSQVAPSVGPNAGGASKVADPKAGAALPEDGPRPTPTESTLAGRGSGSGMAERTERSPAVGPSEGVPPPRSPQDLPLPTRVVFVDASTGREVPGVRWTEPLRIPSAPAIPTPLDLSPHRNGESAPLAFSWDPLRVEPLPGWVYLGSRVIPSRRMPRAREGRMTVLLHREVDVRVEILGPDGRVAEGATVSDAFVAGTTIRPVEEQRASDGTRRLRGIPFFAGETLHLAAHWTGPLSDRPASLELSSVPSEEDPAALPGWHGPMPDRPETTVLAVIRLSGATGPRDHNESDNDSELLDHLEVNPLPDPALLGTARLQLIDRDGKPATGVRVALRGIEGTTDKDGRVTLAGVHQGTSPILVRDDGWTFPIPSVTVVGRQVTEVVAREIMGGDVEIIVRDADGNPVPFAALEVGRADGQVWYDVDDAGIQRLDPYVDVRGRRLLTHLPPGTLRVRAYHGTRQGQGEVEVVDRGRRVLPITVTR